MPNRKKAFKPTTAQRDQVMLLKAVGMSEEAIAASLNICRLTLRNHFADELLHGHARKSAENYARLQKAAKAGNVTAMKFLASRTDLLPPEAPKPPKEEPLGKKEAAEIEAHTAHEGSSWGEILN
jgi:hypothetical protein